MKYKICILSIDHQPQFLGGIKRVTSILGEEWQKEGHECLFLTLCISSIRPSSVREIPQFFFPYPKNLSNQYNTDLFVKFINEKSIDIILNPHVEDRDLTRLAISIHRMTKTPLINALHFSPTHVYDITKKSFFVSYHIKKDINKWFLDLILWCRFHIYQSKVIKQREMEWQEKVISESNKTILLSNNFLHFFKKHPDKIYAINNPLDPKIPISKNFNKENKVVWCGRLDITGMKRVDRMLKIWNIIQPRHKEWTLQILGSGDLNKINTIISSEHIQNVEIKGFCDPYEYYDKASIVAMTSTTEGWGMVLVEGSAFGCTPIAFNSYESISDIIQDGINGILVQPFDLKEYAHKLEYLMDNKKEREKMGEQARLSVCKFNSSIIAEQWINLFKTTIT